MRKREMSGLPKQIKPKDWEKCNCRSKSKTLKLALVQHSSYCFRMFSVRKPVASILSQAVNRIVAVLQSIRLPKQVRPLSPLFPPSICHLHFGREKKAFRHPNGVCTRWMLLAWCSVDKVDMVLSRLLLDIHSLHIHFCSIAFYSFDIHFTLPSTHSDRLKIGGSL